MARAARLLLALALPVVCVGARRASEAEGASMAAEAALMPMPQVSDELMEAISAWWKTANYYVGHKYILAFADCWTIYNNLMKIKSVSGQKKAAAAFVVTGEYFTTLEAAQDVDRSITAATGMKTNGETSWSCDQYYPDEVLPKMHFTKAGFIPTETFESVNDERCLNTLRGQVGIIRWGICHIEAQANAWAEEMASTDLKEFFVAVVRGKACEGRPLYTSLDPRFRPLDGEACGRRKDKAECAEECFNTDNCSAVSYKDKTRECCFMEGDVKVEPGSNVDQCFEQVGTRERFMMLGPERLAEWLKAKGFEAYAETARTYRGFGLTGMVLAFMTEPTLAKWLGLATAQEAEVLRCRILAELDNDPGRECGAAPPPPGLAQRALAKSPVSAWHIDHGLLWPKGSNGKWYTVKWASDFFRRYAPHTDTKKWSTMVYDLSATWLNANGFHRIVSGGPSGLVSPFVLLKSISTSTGLLKFREATSLTSCESISKQLQPVIDQMQAVPMRQTEAVAQRIRKR